jgi:hypothetical protein
MGTRRVNPHQTRPFRSARAFCCFAIQCKLVYTAPAGLKCCRISQFSGIYTVALKVHLCILSNLMDRPNHVIYHLIPCPYFPAALAIPVDHYLQNMVYLILKKNTLRHTWCFLYLTARLYKMVEFVE